MSNELSYITQALTRIEEKIDSGFKDHEGRISQMEGGIKVLRFAVGIIAGLFAAVLGIYAA